MPRHLHTTWPALLIACVAALAAPCRAVEAPAAPAPSSSAQTTGVASPPAAQPESGEASPEATPPPRDIDRLVVKLSGEHRELEAEGVRFPVFHRAASAPARGAVVLVPGDGEYPTADAALAQLREQLPAFGWSIWLPGLERPPRIHTLTHASPAGTASPGEAPAPPVEPAPAPQPAAEPSVAASAPALEQQRIEDLQAWAKRGAARLAVTVAAAAGEGEVVLIAEGVAAPLLLAQVAAAPASAHAVVLIEPLTLPGLTDAWPMDFAVPVLEVLGAAMQQEHGAALEARAATLPSYRQLRLEEPGEGPFAGEAPLVRRLRGWLLSLER